ncbi:MAG: NYN domain-containing protein [Candidatus Omnitrophica bacterium]|nr:NYN domain-containing protein [Candidatus Omnitrophota bacterium]
MSRQLLLDGYNILKQTPDFASALDRSLEDGRAALIRFIRERRPQGSDRNEVTLVFDGQNGMGGMDLSAGLAMDIRVVFTQGFSADDHIRNTVEDSANPGQIICVTNDRELAIACRHRGAVIWSVEDFVAHGYKEESSAAHRSAETRRREGDGKVIPHTMARKIDEELTDRWLRKKV